MKIIRVDMTIQKVLVEECPTRYENLGGRGLTSTLLSEEVEPTCYALGQENKLVIAPGLLTGTTAPSSARTSVGAKSPLTGGIKESNVGGIAGQYLAGHNIKAIVIEGQPTEKKCWVLIIDGENFTLEECDGLAGMGNYATLDLLREKYGHKSAVISTGPAGEAGAAIATLAVGDMEGRPVRHAARGGLGAVMASKGLKSIVLLPPGTPIVQPANPDLFKETVKSFAKTTVKEKKALTDYGSAVLVNVINAVSGMPSKNFSRGYREDAGDIAGERLRELCLERGGTTGHTCSRGCVIRCSNVVHGGDKNYLTAGLEYETIALLGPNCGLMDLDGIADLDRLCDDIGVDTIEMGVTLGVAMEGKLLPFGDLQLMKDAISSVVSGDGFGKVLAQGAAVTGKILGVERVPVVKGQAMAAYDPRALKGMGVTYATSPMGADHTAGPCTPGRGGVNCQEAAGQVDLSRLEQKIAMTMDTLGLCIFAGAVTENLPAFAALASSFLGTDISVEKLLEQAGEILKLETEFNQKAGISQTSNNLPPFFRTESLGKDGLVFDVPAADLNSFSYE